MQPPAFCRGGPVYVILHRLKTVDISQETDVNYSSILGEKHLLNDLLNKLSREMNQYTTFNLTLPNERPIYQVDEKHSNRCIRSSDGSEDIE
ncbi:unnamed protein product [Didymodactylos carnosus]|uniref:Uncharacterized protein n=1 Tax=Didymodactylos carnosus TaxID=1234261 RepID=A0A814U135_9BILA|nr:unnamed protein product [Didymodactylos carnosus]CAF3932386.1 unnamed protein product [Didymodactylos carnosus]